MQSFDMSSHIYGTPFFLLLWIQTIKCMSLMNQQQHSYFMDNSGSSPDNDVADFIVSKGYLPKDQDLPKTSIVKSVDNDVTYLLSKLSDDELIKLLNEQPKKSVYDLDDIVKVAVDTKSTQDNNKIGLNIDQTAKPRENIFANPTYTKNKRFRTVSGKDNAVFRLNEKPPLEALGSNDGDANYAALQKLNNLLYSRPQEENEKSEEDDEKRELLFDVLVAQLKTLCCKRTKSKKRISQKSTLSDVISQDNFYSKSFGTDVKKTSQKGLEGASTEYMFLIINDEITGNGSDELISVDPESLEKNSSVLLLGPITTPLSNTQLKSVMSRISHELSKPDYLPLLQQISDGTLSGSNMRLMKSLVTGPETRRYIKPHRCNHQSKLAKVYGGPKWLICTGYLNLNIPSLYDK